jgi:hypothetical protein
MNSAVHRDMRHGSRDLRGAFWRSSSAGITDIASRFRDMTSTRRRSEK